MGLRIHGLQRVITAHKKIKDRIAKKMEEAAEVSCHIILEKALYYCPVDKGDLYRSGKVTVTGKGAAVRGFVEFTDPKAVWVHENLEDRHAPPTSAKFLERAAREMLPECSKATDRVIQVR